MAPVRANTPQNECLWCLQKALTLVRSETLKEAADLCGVAADRWSNQLDQPRAGASDTQVDVWAGRAMEADLLEHRIRAIIAAPEIETPEAPAAAPVPKPTHRTMDLEE